VQQGSKTTKLLLLDSLLQEMFKVWFLFLVAVSLPQSLKATSDGSCSKDDSNCDEPLGSVMAEAAEKSKAIEVDDTDEVDGVFEPCKVSQDKDGGQLHRMLMNKAGHKIREGSLEKVHCQPDDDRFLSNGYYRAISEVGEDEVRVMALLPGQGLQPHAHNDVEDIKVSFGMLAYFTWLEGPGIPSNRTVTAGQPVGCASGVTHALFAGPEGAVFHEALSSEGSERQTWFAPMIRD